MAEDPLIVVEGASKRFCRQLKRSLWYGVCDVASEFTPWRSDQYHSLRRDEFWAIDDISFELRRGECLGLIGKNGAGKTTLLKMLNGLIKPDKGAVTLRGQVGALIALGAGFNPILTGRENIYVNASVLGLRKSEIAEKFERIVDFADIREFIDAPVQSYSSGMQVRLGFAVATALEPDILLLDEVLAVGDAAFRSKCYNRIDEMREKCAVIFVSHSMEQVARICTSVLLMKKGIGTRFSSLQHGITAYESINVESDGPEEGGFIKVYGPVQTTIIRLRSINILEGENLTIEIEGALSTSVCLSPRVVIHGISQPTVAEANWARGDQGPIEMDAGKFYFRLHLANIRLKAGPYWVSVLFYDQQGQTLIHGHRATSFRVTGNGIGETPYQLAISVSRGLT